MPNTKFRMRNAIVLTAICVGAANVSAAEEELPAELLRCSLIDDSSARLGCYDAFSGRKLPAAHPPVDTSPQPQPDKSLDNIAVETLPQPDKSVDDIAVETQPQPEKPLDDIAAATLPQPEKSLDDIDAETLPQPEKSLDDIDAETRPGGYSKKVEELTVRGTVSRCGKDAYKKYLFYFDNGQVWKQASNKRLYFKDCNFGVTITQDTFGYKMQVDGENSRIRISRIK